MSDFIYPTAIGLALAGLILIWSAGAWVTDNHWKSETVERGLAAYCPNNGEWAWIGECDD